MTAQKSGTITATNSVKSCDPIWVVCLSKQVKIISEWFCSVHFFVPLNELLNALLTARSDPHRKNRFLNYLAGAAGCQCLSQDVLGGLGPTFGWQ